MKKSHNVFCSSCGECFHNTTPEGFSHCEDHAHLQPRCETCGNVINPNLLVDVCPDHRKVAA